MSQDFWGSRLSAAQRTTSAVQVEPSGAVATKKHRGRNAGFMITKNLVRSSKHNKHNKTSKNYFCLLLASFSPQFVYMFGRVAQCGASPISPNSCPFSFSALPLPLFAFVQLFKQARCKSNPAGQNKNTTESSMGASSLDKTEANLLFVCFW